MGRKKNGRYGNSARGSAMGQRSLGLAQKRPIGQAPVTGASEFKQVSVVIVEDHLGLPVSDIAKLRAMCAKLPFEASMSLVANLAGRVETMMSNPYKQLELARQLFRVDYLIEKYATLIRTERRLSVFAPQSLYALMRVLVEEALDVPLATPVTPKEHAELLRAIIASNSVIETGRDLSSPPSLKESLAYELQVGAYYSRSSWMEEIVRPQALLRLAETPELSRSPEYVPIPDWLEESGITAQEQWVVAFGLGSVSNAWHPDSHPHIAQNVVDDLFGQLGLADRQQSALHVLSANREQLKSDFAALAPERPERLVWETRPFNNAPFLRLSDAGGLLLMGRPWLHNWLSDGFYYRPLDVARALDAAQSSGRTDHVQRYTAYMGEVFEQYCLNRAQEAFPASTPVVGEQKYGKKGKGGHTSDVAVLCGRDLIVFEVHGRRPTVEALVGGDPELAGDELWKLLVRKINQLGVSIGALQSGEAELPGIDLAKVRWIYPAVVTAGRLWQTPRLWAYLDNERDAKKCLSLESDNVRPVQVFDVRDFEMLMALAGKHNVAGLLKRKGSGRWRARDLAAWLSEDPAAPLADARLPYTTGVFEDLTANLESRIAAAANPAGSHTNLADAAS